MPEFINNKYTSGRFYKTAKAVFINRKGDYEIVSDLYDLFKYAQAQKIVYDLEQAISKCDKILSLSLDEYHAIVKTFYYEVIKHMILEGVGYSFEGNMGWICVNRCRLEKQRPKLDFQATRRNKEKLLKEGVKLFNKEEADWCRANGLDYNGVDYRVYLKQEYCYEIPLLDCKLKQGSDCEFKLNDYIKKSLRDKTVDDLLNFTNGDKNKILDLDLCFRRKLNLCLRADKTLYLNYIRNESQAPVANGKTDRKDRQ
jgi:hypothetical protein